MTAGSVGKAHKVGQTVNLMGVLSIMIFLGLVQGLHTKVSSECNVVQ